MKAARKTKSSATRALALAHLRESRVVDQSILPSLYKLLDSERSDDVLASAMSLLSELVESAAEARFIAAMSDRRFRFKYYLLDYFLKHGSGKAVPAVASYVERALRGSRQRWVGDSDLAQAVVFLNRFLDSHPEVVRCFSHIVLAWHTLSKEESQQIKARVGWIRIRVR